MVYKFPDSLTVKQWSAKKGVVAKMAGETGMTAALKKLEAAKAKVKWQDLEPNASHRKNIGQFADETVESLTSLKPAYEAAQRTLEPFRRELKAVRDLALELEKTWQKSRVIPASSRKYVGDMAKAANSYLDDIDVFPGMWARALKDALADDNARARRAQKVKTT